MQTNLDIHPLRAADPPVNNVARECVLVLSPTGLSIMDQQDGVNPFMFPVNQYIRSGGFTFSYSI